MSLRKNATLGVRMLLIGDQQDIDNEFKKRKEKEKSTQNMLMNLVGCMVFLIVHRIACRFRPWRPVKLT
jgi:hypothetical protein